MVIAFCRSTGCTDALRKTQSSYSCIAIIAEAELKLEALRETEISIRDKIRNGWLSTKKFHL